MKYIPARQAVPIAGLVIGLALGLLYTWAIEPVDLVNTYPSLLRTDHRHDWIRMAALSYVADGDLERAQTRLDGIEHADIESAISALIEEYAATGHPASTMRSLAALAQTLDIYTSAMQIYLDAPAPPSPTPAHTRTPLPTPTPTAPPVLTLTPSRTASPSPTPTPVHFPTPSPTPTPAHSPTPSPTPSLLSRLQLAEQEQLCQPGQRQHIEVVIKDERGRGLAGVQIWLMWLDGADRAVTGLKPQQGTGYADFDAEWGVNYSLHIGELGRPLVTALRLEPCPVEESEPDQEPLIGSWRILLEPRSP